MSTKIVPGPFISGEVVNAQTHTPMAAVEVVVSALVFTDAAMTNGTTVLLTSDVGVFTAYANIGIYDFTTTEPLAGPIGSINVIGNTPSDSQALLTAAFAYTDVETVRAEAAESSLLNLIAANPQQGGGGTGGGGGGSGPPPNGLTVVDNGNHTFNLLPFGDVTILPDPNIDDAFDLTAAAPVTLVPNGDDSFGVFT